MDTTTNTRVRSDDMKKFISDVELDLTFHIVWNLKNKKISLAEAKSLAADFLKILPAKDKEELLGELRKLCDAYIEACDVYVTHNGTYQNEKRERMLAEMRKHIQEGNIEQALLVAKGEK